LRLREVKELPEPLRFKPVFVNDASGIMPGGMIQRLPSMDTLKVIDATVSIHLLIVVVCGNPQAHSMAYYIQDNQVSSKSKTKFEGDGKFQRHTVSQSFADCPVDGGCADCKAKRDGLCPHMGEWMTQLDPTGVLLGYFEVFVSALRCLNSPCAWPKH